MIQVTDEASQKFAELLGRFPHAGHKSGRQTRKHALREIDANPVAHTFATPELAARQATVT